MQQYFSSAIGEVSGEEDFPLSLSLFSLSSFFSSRILALRPYDSILIGLLRARFTAVEGVWFSFFVFLFFGVTLAV